MLKWRFCELDDITNKNKALCHYKLVNKFTSIPQEPILFLDLNYREKFKNKTEVKEVKRQRTRRLSFENLTLESESYRS
jgi:hypothetical protein